MFGLSVSRERIRTAVAADVFARSGEPESGTGQCVVHVEAHHIHQNECVGKAMRHAEMFFGRIGHGMHGRNRIGEVLPAIIEPGSIAEHDDSPAIAAASQRT